MASLVDGEGQILNESRIFTFEFGIRNPTEGAKNSLSLPSRSTMLASNSHAH